MMRRIMCMGMLLLLFIATNSFQNSTSYYKNEGALLAVLDGKNFDLRDNDKYHAELMYKSVSMSNTGNSQKKQVDALFTFYGVSLEDEKGNNPYTQKLEIEYAFNEGALGDANDLKIELNYDHKSYYQLPDDTKFKITQLTWSPDRRTFAISADFDCQLRKWGYPAESQPVMHMKGKMENITVSVPAWINVKNPGQEAQVK